MDSKEKKEGYQILGINIYPHTKGDFLQLVENRIADEDQSSPPFFVVTVNPEIAVQAIFDNDFKQILNSSSVNTADGIGIRWAVKALYDQSVERITGSDSIGSICRICENCSQPIFLYGAMPTIAEKAAGVLQQKMHNLKIAGTYSPEQPDMQLEDLPIEVQHKLLKASVIFVALGAPAQEKWIFTNLSKLPNCRLIMGIGGSFDFLAGKVKRAPKWMRKYGLEWLYRLYLEPGRWRRMLKYPVFVLNILFLKYTTK